MAIFLYFILGSILSTTATATSEVQRGLNASTASLNKSAVYYRRKNARHASTVYYLHINAEIMEPVMNTTVNAVVLKGGVETTA
ncbi:hypothetical protein FRC18_004853 [Serendipita sp. 400]|nr:hypothetical protein FRC18_004853 [Serendipita sp. 400]